MILYADDSKSERCVTDSSKVGKPIKRYQHKMSLQVGLADAESGFTCTSRLHVEVFESTAEYFRVILKATRHGHIKFILVFVASIIKDSLEGEKNGAAFDGKKNNFFELSMEVEISCSGVSGMEKIAQIAMNGFNTNGEENVTQSVMTMERETSLTSTIRQ